MIYFKPLYGLCNRMRALDSALFLCAKYKHDLTILWSMDFALNNSFDKLFLHPKVEGFKLNIVECPIGFPELYFNDVCRLPPASRQSILEYKKHYKKCSLNDIQESILKNIQKISIFNVLNNCSLFRIYASRKYGDVKSLKEMDESFYDKVSNIVHPLFQSSSSNSYISSCYKLCPTKNEYANFVPIELISIEIKKITQKFNNTFGIHIRRSDHKHSTRLSTTSKFFSKILDLINHDPKTTFFCATDDKNIKKLIITEFGNNIITNNTRSYNRADPIAIVDAVIDLFCLSKTKKIYGSHHSSFSQLAADIGRIDEVTIR